MEMKENHSLALIVAYYLSKFDDDAYSNLGFTAKVTAHREIGRLLGVNSNSVKNMRDEFDPYHENTRVGWYQRPLRPSRTKVLESFQELSEVELREIVLEILTNPDFRHSEDFSDIIEPISKRSKKRKGKEVFILRGPTGRKAEEAFIQLHQSGSSPFNGELIDKREYGCGFDFEIINDDGPIQVEIKGLDGESGGVLFTSKEWETAKQRKDSYHLVIVRNVSKKATFQFLQNPAGILNPKKNIFTTVQINWNVSPAELSALVNSQT